MLDQMSQSNEKWGEGAVQPNLYTLLWKNEEFSKVFISKMIFRYDIEVFFINLNINNGSNNNSEYSNDGVAISRPNLYITHFRIVKPPLGPPGVWTIGHPFLDFFASIDASF